MHNGRCIPKQQANKLVCVELWLQLCTKPKDPLDVTSAFAPLQSQQEIPKQHQTPDHLGVDGCWGLFVLPATLPWSNDDPPPATDPRFSLRCSGDKTRFRPADGGPADGGRGSLRVSNCARGVEACCGMPTACGQPSAERRCPRSSSEGSLAERS